MVSLFLRFITHIFSPKFIAFCVVLFHNCLSQLSV
nr:MAG TPA: hypothetical protein [Caudoviricetes sp.]